MKIRSAQSRIPESADRMVANVQPPGWGKPSQEQPQTTVYHDFTHVDLFSHAPQRAPVQMKLTVGAPNDVYEQEADRVADQVVNMPDSATQPVQRQESEEGEIQMKPEVQRQEGEEDELQMKPLAASITPLVQREAMPEEEELQAKPIQREAMPEEEELQAKPIQREAMSEEEDEPIQAKPSQPSALSPQPSLETQLNSSKSGGSPLSTEVRSFMEPRFGADFSQVRVHTGSDSIQMNRDLNAQAFTHGQNVFFGAGKAPNNDALTAHELTHVVQQNGGAAMRSLKHTEQLRQKPFAIKSSKNVQTQIQRRYTGELETIGNTFEYLSAAVKKYTAEGYSMKYAEYNTLKQDASQYKTMQELVQKLGKTYKDVPLTESQTAKPRSSTPQVNENSGTPSKKVQSPQPAENTKSTNTGLPLPPLKKVQPPQPAGNTKSTNTGLPFPPLKKIPPQPEKNKTTKTAPSSSFQPKSGSLTVESLPELNIPATNKPVFKSPPEFISVSLDGSKYRVKAGQNYLNTDLSAKYMENTEAVKESGVTLMLPTLDKNGEREEDVRVVSDGHHRFVWGSFHGQTISARDTGRSFTPQPWREMKYQGAPVNLPKVGESQQKRNEPTSKTQETEGNKSERTSMPTKGSKGRGRQMLEKARENNVNKGGNPDEAGGTVNSYFSKPKATAISKNGDITVEMELHTLNLWDRVSWKCRVGPKGTRLVPEDRSWWSNPAWNPSEMSRYKFKGDFSGFSADGIGAGVKREIRATIPGANVKRVFGDDLSKLNESSIICFGMEVFYGGGGPTAATKTEFEQAYGTASTAHQYALEATSSPESYGYVDLSKLGLKQGEWLTDEEVWNLDLPDNPSPNIRLPLPENYANKDLIAPLEPKGGMKIATRIENEATLKVSSLATLKNIISYLHNLAKDESSIATIMSGDETLDQFNWSVTATEDNSMVFTDVYLDDLKHTALRAGVGIRKRSSDTATKLNVKTGTGYQVGELDENNKETPVKSPIYRRHEIGYDLQPDAKISNIGTFLAAGVKENDPWNRGGEQANLALPEGEKIDFANLQGTMVLQGDRKKFNLKAVHKKTGGAINIEISCDHTVGREFSNYEKGERPEDLFTDLTGKYQQAFNVEMELEHLGAGGPTEKPTPSTPSESGSVGETPSPSSEAPTKRPHPSHPGRLYMRDDAADPKFNTPSFEVFAKAQSRMVGTMQTHLQDSSELHEDKQKLETLFASLFRESTAYGSKPDRGVKKPYSKKVMAPTMNSPAERVGEMILEGKLEDVSGAGMNCSIRALMRSSGHEIDEKKVELIRSHVNAEAEVKSGSFLGLGTLEKEAMILITKMDADYLNNRPVVVLYDRQGKLESVKVRTGAGKPVYVYLRGYHYQAVV